MPDVELPKMKLEVEGEAKPETPLTAEQIYLKRQAEVAQQDNEDFSDDLDARCRASENEARGRERGKARDAAHRRTNLPQAPGRGGAAGQRGFFRLSAGKSRPQSTASAATGTCANRSRAANGAAETQSAQPADMGGGHRGGGRGGHARLPDAHRAEHPG